MKSDEIKFKIGETAYLRTDIEQRERFVTAISIRQNSIMYELSYNTESRYHYDFEISKKKDTLKSLN